MWRQRPDGRVQHAFEPIVLGATLALIPVLVIEGEAKSEAWKTFAAVANWVIWAVFAAELLFVLFVAPRKRAALRAHWFDVAIVVLTVPAFGRFLASLRLVRLARLLRLLRLGALLTRAVQRERLVSSGTAFRFAALVTAFVVVVGGAAQAVVDDGDFHSTWNGIWWAMQTVTTVGYGDVTVTSVHGRVVAMLVMVAGIGFLSVLTATVASYFVKSERSPETDELQETLNRIEDALTRLRSEVSALSQRR